MDINLTEFLNIVRKWESEHANVSAYFEIIHGPRMAIRFGKNKVAVQPEDHIGVYNAEAECELSATLLPNMTFMYSESEGEEPHRSILEVRAPMWRLILAESNPV